MKYIYREKKKTNYKCKMRKKGRERRIERKVRRAEKIYGGKSVGGKVTLYTLITLVF